MNLRQHLQAIRDDRGTLTPAVVVETARNPDHPLHNRFEWDDTLAAEQWRLEQARQLLKVTFRVNLSKPTDLRAFIVQKSGGMAHSEHVPTEEVLADPFAAELLLRQMKRDWQIFKRRYDSMAEFASFIRLQIEGEAS
jgi:hypothetical protein